MQRFLIAILMGFIGMTLGTAEAQAANPPARMGDPVTPSDANYIRKADNGIEFDAGGGQLRYGETVSGSTFDTESGWMPSFAASGTMLLTAKKYAFLNNLYLNLQGGITSGNVKYDGGLQFSNGTTIPYNNQTSHASIYTVSGQVGHAFFVQDNLAIIPMIDLGYRYWSRAVGNHGFASAQENYQHGEILGGVLAQYSPAERWVLSLTGEVGSTFGASMNLPDYATTLDLGSDTVWKGKAKVGYFFTQNFEATGSFQFSGFGYGKSKIVNGVSEPDSYTHEATALIGIGYHL